MKIALSLALLFALAGCKNEDNSHFAMSRKYQELEFAYDRCLGNLRYKDDGETFEQRLACTRAVYGGDQ